ncbi:MAG: hypothetical protein AAF721_28815 [Myxococcota bacterium]
MQRAKTVAIAAGWALAGCGDDLPPAAESGTSTTGTTGAVVDSEPSGVASTGNAPATAVRLWVTPALELPVSEIVARTPGLDDVTVVVSEAPRDDAAADVGQGSLAVAVVTGEQECDECFALQAAVDDGAVDDGVVDDGAVDDGAHGFVVSGGDLLGAQYGVAALLERAGVRFFTPFSGHVPDDLVAALHQVEVDGTVEAPQMHERGVQLHTLHPLESLWAFWIPGEENLDRAKAMIDWYVKLRANYVQWVALQDIVEVEGAYEPWREHTAAIIEYAHARGVRVGMGIQLLGSGNLQRAYDLIDAPGPAAEEDAQIDDALIAVTDGLAFDRFTLSFGEFVSSDPQVFVDRIDRVWAALRELLPQADMTTVVHVGGTDNLRVDYMGESYIYYMLAQFADAAVVPWVHTTMYYNLFQDAGGAYHHDEFDEHRALVLDRLAEGEAVAYFPETAYWVAFDNSVPTYLPVYLESRLHDINRIAEVGPPLQQHITFSSGWEWGYWQNDYAVLRWNWARSSDTDTTLAEMFAPLPDGAALADVVARLGRVQSSLLIDERLGPYLAGRDLAIDASFEAGVVSQPDRMGFVALAELPQAERDTFVQTVVQPLEAHAETLAAMVTEVAALSVDGGEVWRDEILDGIEVDLQRTRYIVALYRASAAFGAGEDPTPFLEAADLAFAAARVVVDRRHAALHDPRGARLISGDAINPTRYSNGYLEKADTLCYWVREREKVDNLLAGVTALVTACFDIGG